MTWLTPGLAGLAAAVAVPALLILYFLKLRRREVEVSSTLLWKKSIEDLQANAPFQRLRRNILLLLQLLVLAAALLALAQPQLEADLASGRRHVILIDRSASMSATDGDAEGRSRLEVATARALDLVDSLREPGFIRAMTGGAEGDQAMVIAFDTHAQVLQNYTTDKAALRRVLGAIEPTDAPSRLAEAFKLAKANSRAREFREDLGFVPVGPPVAIHIFSDGRLPDAQAGAPDPEDLVELHAVGSPQTGNIGITALRVQRDFDDPARARIFVAAQNTFATPKTLDVELVVDGAPVAVKQITLPPAADVGADATGPAPAPGTAGAGTATTDRAEGPGPGGATPAPTAPAQRPGLGGVVFQLDRPEAGAAAVRLIFPLHEGDVLKTDDLAYAVIPPARRLSVGLVTDGNLFLRAALEGMNLSGLVVLSPDQYQALLGGSAGAPPGIELGDFDVVVLDRWLPLVPDPAKPGAPSTRGLPPGRFLVLGAVPPPPMGLADVGPVDDPGLVVDYRRDHPALALAGLSELVIAKAHRYRAEPETPVTVLASSQVGPVIAEVNTEATRALLAAFDLAESDWPFKPGFVLFVASAIQHLGHGGIEAAGTVVRPGDTLTERVPLGSQAVRLTLPSGDRRDLVPGSDGSVAWGPLPRVGVYTLSWAGQAKAGDVEVDGRVRRAIPVNLADPDESDIRTVPALALASRVVVAEQATLRGQTRRLWPSLLLAALGIVMLEWYVYNRKVAI
ncbi:MAG TPA: VWA domain-containing protein [Phycisphaerales bacterium]|nr:VWA domain-containing protein [Phycisphaerales bacterium]